MTRSRLYETWIHEGLARRCEVCQRVFWRARRKKLVDRGGRLVPKIGAEVPLHPHEKYCGLPSCRRAVARRARTMTGVGRWPRLGWMSTAGEAAAAMGVEEEQLRGLIERHSKPDLYDEVVSRLPAVVLQTELLGERMAAETSLGRLLRYGVVCRRLAASKREGLASKFHGLGSEPLTDWVIFVRAYEGKPAEMGDTSELVRPTQPVARGIPLLPPRPPLWLGPAPPSEDS